MKKGTKVIYEGKPYTVWTKEGSSVIIYNPDAKYPELTMIRTGTNKVKKGE